MTRAHKQKSIYSLTEMGIALLPVLAQMGAWGRRFLPVRKDLAIRARILEENGPRLWEQFMEELRIEHLGGAERAQPGRRRRSVRDRLRVAYEDAVAEERQDGHRAPAKRA